MNVNDKIKKYICKINYQNKEFISEGSGVIVNTKNDDYFYIFTAKHTFFEYDKDKNNQTNIIGMEVEKILKSSIKVENSDEKTIVNKNDVLDVIGIDTKYDFLLIIIKKNNLIKKLRPLSICVDNFKQCVIYGYPELKEPDNEKSVPLSCTYSDKKDSTSTYEVDSKKTLNSFLNLNPHKEIIGISGSGIFVSNIFQKIYLSGIQIQTASYNRLVCLDIRALSKEINEALTEKGKEPIGVFSTWKRFKISLIMIIIFVGGFYLYNENIKSNQIYKYHKKMIHSKYKSDMRGIIIRNKEGKELNTTDSKGVFKFENKHKQIEIFFKVNGKSYTRTIFPAIGGKNVLFPVP